MRPLSANGGWLPEANGVMHNFSFTTEVHYWFLFDAASILTLDFAGDDDVWVFVNHRLAVDLGGWHPPVEGSVTLGAATGATYGLTAGNVYEIAVFQVERKTTGSSFKLTLSGFDTSPSDCKTNCGDGVITPPEQCDDGAGLNTGAYNHCGPSCTLGPRCGDAIKQDQHGEQCDNGVNDGSYGGCAPDCQIGPHCGDGIVQPDYEQCDDGTNDGSYGKCAPGCVLGPTAATAFCSPGSSSATTATT
jgi:fibro-slime domain-containing protein